MIAIDIKMPEKCIMCPFVRQDEKFVWKCTVKEFKGTRRASDCAVSLNVKPQDCPLMEIGEVTDYDQQPV